MSGQKIREERKRQKVTLEQLAEMTGLSAGFISRMEASKRGAKLEHKIKIARALAVSVDRLQDDDEIGPDADLPSTVPVVGVAGANPDGSILFGEGQTSDDEAPMPPNGTARTVAVEVRGDSMRGIAENGWWVYYDDRRDPPTEDFLGRICVVGLADGRVLIKRLIRGRRKKHFDLESFAAPTLYDQLVEWAAPVTAIIPSENVGRVRARGAA